MHALAYASDGASGIRFLDRAERPSWQSYRALAGRAASRGAALAHAGVGPGERVAIVLPTCPEFLEVFFGAMLAGAIPVPLYPPFRLGRLDEYHQRTAAMLQAVNASLVVADNRIQRVLWPTIERGRPRLGCLSTAELEQAKVTGSWPAAPASADQIAFIQLSSGTTGQPKPIPLTHRQVLANVSAILTRIFEAYPEDDAFQHRGVSWLPLYHDMGLVGCVLAAVCRPGELTLMPPELFVSRPATWLRALSRYRGSISPAPNFAYALCADRIQPAELDGVDLSGWHLALSGAEPVAPAVLERFSERFAPWGFRAEALTPVYGLAEATLAVTFSAPRSAPRTIHFDALRLSRDGAAEESAAGHGKALVSVGTPLSGYSIRIARRDGQVCAPGSVGRVLVSGPSLYAKSWTPAAGAEPAASAMGAEHAADRDGVPDDWLDTGDLGFIHDGELYLVGRAKDIVIIRGRNHAPQEFEQAADYVPGVRTGCVVAIGIEAADGSGEELVLLVEKQRDAKTVDGELSQAIASRVLEQSGVRPRAVVLLAPGTLPRTSSGKVRRGEAKLRYLDRTLSPPQPVTALRLGRELYRSHQAKRRVAQAAKRVRASAKA